MYVWRQKWLSHDIQNLPKLIMVELAWFSEVFRLCNTRRPRETGLKSSLLNFECTRAVLYEISINAEKHRK